MMRASVSLITVGIPSVLVLEEPVVTMCGRLDRESGGGQGVMTGAAGLGQVGQGGRSSEDRLTM
jgi:hypothetical protein